MFSENPNKLPSNVDSWFDLPKNRVTEDFKSMKKIIISDCDGILTDGKSIYGKDGKMFKTYGAYDKEAIEFLASCNWDFYFVTDDKAGLDITSSRLSHLQKSILGKYSIKFEYGNVDREKRIDIIKQYRDVGYLVVFIGDSISDIKAMSLANYGCCTANSPKVVKEYCHFVSGNVGSEGGFADLILEVNKKINEIESEKILYGKFI